MLKKAGFFTFFSLFSRLSLTFLHFLGKILGYFMYFMPNKTKKVTQTNILLAFSDQNNKFKHDLIKKSLIESSKTDPDLENIRQTPEFQKLIDSY